MTDCKQVAVFAAYASYRASLDALGAEQQTSPFVPDASAEIALSVRRKGLCKSLQIVDVSVCAALAVAPAWLCCAGQMQ